MSTVIAYNRRCLLSRLYGKCVHKRFSSLHHKLNKIFKGATNKKISNITVNPCAVLHAIVNGRVNAFEF